MAFSDEKKKINLDGLDESSYYCHDLRKEKLVFSKRVQGGGGVMIWSAFRFNSKTPSVFIDTRLDALGYRNLLSTALLSYGGKWRSKLCVLAKQRSCSQSQVHYGIVSNLTESMLWSGPPAHLISILSLHFPY